MSFLSRVATIATMTFALAALGAQSTPGEAAELAPVPTPAVATIAEPPASVETLPGDTIAYPTLEAAVAAPPSHDDAEALRCLATSIFFEAKGEPLAGQLAVAEVILNRAASGRFPASVCAVVTQRGQFGFVRAGRLPAVDEDHSAYRRAMAVAKVALADAWDSPAAKALYFNTPGRAPGTRLARVASIGNHVFWR